jgi:hypothetical protein
MQPCLAAPSAENQAVELGSKPSAIIDGGFPESAQQIRRASKKRLYWLLPSFQSQWRFAQCGL